MVQIQKSRMAFIHEKVILKYPDEDFDVQQYNLVDEDEGDDNDPINNNYANQEERKIMNDPHYIIPFSHPSHSLSYDMPRDYPPIRPLKISPRSNASTENTQGGINGGIIRLLTMIMIIILMEHPFSRIILPISNLIRNMQRKIFRMILLLSN